MGQTGMGHGAWSMGHGDSFRKKINSSAQCAGAVAESLSRACAPQQLPDRSKGAGSALRAATLARFRKRPRRGGARACSSLFQGASCHLDTLVGVANLERGGAPDASSISQTKIGLQNLKEAAQKLGGFI